MSQHSPSKYENTKHWSSSARLRYHSVACSLIGRQRIEALRDLPPHLEELDMPAFWGWLGGCLTGWLRDRPGFLRGNPCTACALPLNRNSPSKPMDREMGDLGHAISPMCNKLKSTLLFNSNDAPLQYHKVWVSGTPPPLYKLRQSTKLIQSLRLLSNWCQINAVPTPAVAWTRAWLIQEGYNRIAN